MTEAERQLLFAIARGVTYLLVNVPSLPAADDTLAHAGKILAALDEAAAQSGEHEPGK